jgi:hypothetical protein
MEFYVLEVRESRNSVYFLVVCPQEHSDSGVQSLSHFRQVGIAKLLKLEDGTQETINTLRRHARRDCVLI